MQIESIRPMDLLYTAPMRSTATGSFDAAMRQASTSVGAAGLEAMFAFASSQTGLPVQLLKAVAKAESDFDQSVVSSAGAVGIMQLMPDAAQEVGVTDRNDPAQNILGGARYLRRMYDRYGGDLTLTLAAYNAGPGNVDRYGGVPPFRETQSYIRKIGGFLNMNLDLSGAKVSRSTKPDGLDVLDGDLTAEAMGAYCERLRVLSQTRLLEELDEDNML